MMTAFATVKTVMTTAEGFRVELSCQQQSSCAHCASKKNCGNSMVSDAFGNKILNWTLTTKQQVMVGQEVEIGFPKNRLLFSAAIIYLLPLFLLLFGAIVGELFITPFNSGSEVATIVVSFFFAFIGIVIARKIINKREHETLQKVVLIRVLVKPTSNN